MNARKAYEVLSETLDEARDRWTMQVCPVCFGRLNEKDAHPSWPKCECAESALHRLEGCT